MDLPFQMKLEGLKVIRKDAGYDQLGKQIQERYSVRFSILVLLSIAACSSKEQESGWSREVVEAAWKAMGNQKQLLMRLHPCSMFIPVIPSLFRNMGTV